jgi:hypothetical protein
MQFSPASIQSIKSISQHALTRYWNRLAGGRSFPSIEEFDPGPRLHDPKQLVKWTIEDAFGQRCFRALYQGTNVTKYSTPLGPEGDGRSRSKKVNETTPY